MDRPTDGQTDRLTAMRGRTMHLKRIANGEKNGAKLVPSVAGFSFIPVDVFLFVISHIKENGIEKRPTGSFT